MSTAIHGVAPKKLKKVIEAEELCKKSGDLLKLESKGTPLRSQKSRELVDAEELHREKLCKAIKIYKELSLSDIDPTSKIEVLSSFLRNIPDEGREELTRQRDLLGFVSGDRLDRLVRMLVMVASSPEIDSHERSITAVNLYNRGHLDVCFRCFETIAVDKSALITYRIEACRYLFGTEIEENKSLAQECLTEIIEDQSLPSDYRYAIIAGFISKTGVASYLNTVKIRVPYDEEFVFGLQSIFFYSDKNGIRERILSGQHILGMECCDATEKSKIGEILLAVAADTAREENVRADAADVILRLGNADQSKTARALIAEIGHSATVGSNNLMNRIKTVYNNSQNMHDEKIEESVSKFITKMISDSSIRPRPFHEIHQEAADMVRSRKLEPAKRHAAFRALNRVSVDTATFTDSKISISEVFVHVWLRIQRHPAETRVMLEDRLIEELTEMGDTCSSGHAGRFVNVLSGVDVDLRISYESQITANCVGRINARIRSIPDDDLRASVSMGMLPDADPEDREACREFITKALGELHTELYNEFVGEGYISKQDFEMYFSKARGEWLF